MPDPRGPRRKAPPFEHRARSTAMRSSDRPAARIPRAPNVPFDPRAIVQPGPERSVRPSGPTWLVELSALDIADSTLVSDGPGLAVRGSRSSLMRRSPPDRGRVATAANQTGGGPSGATRPAHRSRRTHRAKRLLNPAHPIRLSVGHGGCCSHVPGIDPQSRAYPAHGDALPRAAFRPLG
jgi:hypothetical protein